MSVPDEYLKNLPEIYRDVLSLYPTIEPRRTKGFGLAIPTLYGRLEEQHKPYSLSEVRLACENMAASGVVDMRHGIFAHPTELGEELIAQLTGRAAPDTTTTVPPFPLPPTSR